MLLTIWLNLSTIHLTKISHAVKCFFTLSKFSPNLYYQKESFLDLFSQRKVRGELKREEKNGQSS